MMRINVLRFLSVLFTAVAMSAALAHLFALPNKIDLPPKEYLAVQQIYRGWNLLGIPVVCALASTAALAFAARGRPGISRPALAAAACIAASLALFFLFAYPANRQTLDWTVLPADWRDLRRQWEYSHAASAGLYCVAFVALTLSLATDPRAGGGIAQDSFDRHFR